MTQRNQTIIFAVVGGIVVLGLILVFFGKKPAKPRPAEINFWATEEPTVFSATLNRLKEELPHLTVKYGRLDEANYETELINRLAEGAGADVFMLKSTWVRKHKNKLYPLPQKIFGVTPSVFKETFADFAAKSLLTPEGEILGVPLFVDTLVLFYNKDIFNSEGVAAPPKTWDEFLNVAKKLTKLTPAGDVIRSGAALGTSDNVENWFEIFSSLLLQEGVPVVKADNIALGKQAVQALNFYTSFADQTKTNFSWSGRSPNSLEAFAREETAMIFGFAGDVKRILAQNPRLNLGLSEFPQPKDAVKKVVYASYYFPAVSRLTKNALGAWQFVLSITSRENAEKYLSETGLPPARRDLVSQGAPQGNLEIFYKQSLIASDWPVPDEAPTVTIFREAVRSVNTRAANPETAVNRLGEQLRLLIQTQ